MQNEKPKLKQKQTEIINLIYKHRFLTRNQIQILLNHKHFNRVIVWLNELTEKKYLARHFSRKFNPEPAIYCLDRKSRNIIRANANLKASLLNRAYRDKNLSETFKKHCIFTADIYLSLLVLARKNGADINFFTKTDLLGMRYLILPAPDAYFSIKESESSTKRYFLDVFDYRNPPLVFRKRIRQYFNYYSKNYWQDNSGHSFPEVIMISPDHMKNYTSSFIQKMLNDKNEDILFYVSTWGEIKAQGLRKEVLHKVQP